MGKKKTKTAKKQQSKLAKRLSRSFAKQLGVSENSKPQKVHGIVVSVVDKSEQHKPSPALGRRLLRHKQRQEEQTKNSNNGNNNSKKNNGDQKQQQEKLDFDSARASLWEREAVIEWKRNVRKKDSNNNKQLLLLRKKQQRRRRMMMKCRRLAASTKDSASIVFDAATFATGNDKKSTAQLVRETAQQVQNWKGIAGAATTPNAMPCSSTSTATSCSSLLRAAGHVGNAVSPEAWTESSSTSALQQKNPWDVLASNDDDEAETTGAFPSFSQQQNPVPTFHFAPATFNVATSTAASSITQHVVSSGTLATRAITPAYCGGGNNDIIDPDL